MPKAGVSKIDPSLSASVRNSVLFIAFETTKGTVFAVDNKRRFIGSSIFSARCSFVDGSSSWAVTLQKHALAERALKCFESLGFAPLTGLRKPLW